MTIRLSAPEPEHLALLYEWYNDPSEWRNTLGQCIVSRYALENMLLDYDESPAASGHSMYIVTADGMAVGVVELNDYSPASDTAFVGIYIDAVQRRKGIAVRALGLLAEYCLKRHGIRSLCALVSSANTASAALFAAAGYARCGSLSKWLVDGSGRADMIFFQKIM